MSVSDKEIEQSALDWLVRVNDPAFEQWDDWDGWMAADPRHAATYWSLAETEAEAVESLTSAPKRVMPVVRRAALPRRAAIAAAFALVAVGGGLWSVWGARPQPWSIATAPGEIRSVTLSDGSTVWLDGGTRLAMDRRTPRSVTLESGRALFQVTHDPAHPFRVEAGEVTLTDLGTTFDVTRLDAAHLRVSVTEGQVRVDQDQASTTLDPGQGVIAGPGGLERRTVVAEDVLAWRQGRLSYANERLSVVAGDLARILRKPVTVSPALEGRLFSGSLTSVSATDRERLQSLLGVSIVENGEGWRLEPRRP